MSLGEPRAVSIESQIEKTLIQAKVQNEEEGEEMADVKAAPTISLSPPSLSIS